MSFYFDSRSGNRAIRAIRLTACFVLCIGDGAGTVRAWDWRRAGGGAVASARGHVGAVTAVTSLHSSRADVAASAGVDGVVRVLSLDGADGACITLILLV